MKKEDFKWPSKVELIDAGILVGSAYGGAALSRGIFGAIPLKAPEAGKTDFLKIGARAAFILLGVGLAATVNANNGPKALTGGFAGMAIQQTSDLITDFAAKSSTATSLTASTKAVDKFKARTLGLGHACDCNTQTYALNRPRRRALRAVDTSEYMDTTQPFQPALKAMATDIHLS